MALHLVTGSTGIVGAHVVNELLKRDHQVRGMHRPGSDTSMLMRILAHYGHETALIRSRLELVACDLLDPIGIEESLNEVSYVHHCAALVTFDDRSKDRLWSTNVTGTQHLVDASLAGGVKRLCHVSSTATIGKPAWAEIFDESTPWQGEAGISPYAHSKYHAELEVRRAIEEGLDAFIVNPCVVIGPGRSDRSSFKLIDRVSKGTRAFPTGDTSIVDARDVASWMVEGLEHAGTGERFLLIGQELSYHDLFAAIARTFDRSPPNFALPRWMLEIAWRLEKIRTMITRSEAMVTRHTVSSAYSHHRYDGSKVRRAIPIQTHDLHETLANVRQFVDGPGD